MKQPGPSWAEELSAAGENGDGFSISLADATLHFEPGVTQTRRDRITSLWTTHDPARESTKGRAARLERDRLLALADRIDAGTATQAETREALAKMIRRLVR